MRRLGLAKRSAAILANLIWVEEISCKLVLSRRSSMELNTFGGRCSMQSDCEYFRRRAAEEREAAMKAPDPSARRSHRELADRYEELVQVNAGRLTARMPTARA